MHMDLKHTDTGMDRKALRHAMGGFATGVCVITVADPDHIDGHVVGMTANSFSSVSLDPPLVQWCLDLQAHRYALYARAQTFGINILSAGHEALSRRFARENAHIVPEEGLTHAHDPLKIKDVVGYFACDLYESRLVGDHLVIVGEVRHFESDPAQAGLTFFKGKYGQIGQ
jgi:flavin reductase (DIM6/NTAB) family NADH-FMN oxidoreductase RutF